MKYAVNSLLCRLLAPMATTCLLVLFFTASPTAAKTLQLTDPATIYDLMDYLEFREDPDGSLTIEEVADESNSSRFEPRTGRKRHFGFSRSVFWARLRIENRSTISMMLQW